LFFAILADGERHAGIGDVDDRVHAFLIEPLPGDRAADVRFVLMIRGDHLDGDVLVLRLEFLDGELRADDRSLTGEIRVRPTEIRQHADLHQSANGPWSPATARRREWRPIKPS
jgi:hypothetical protein